MSKKKQPRPFFVSARGIWRVEFNGRQYNLGPDEAEAWKRYGEMMARPSEVVSELVAGVIEGYLDWLQRRVDADEKAPRTYEWYKRHLQSFTDSLLAPKTMTVEQLKPFHVQDWLDSKPRWGASQRNGAVGAVKRAFRWAEQQGHILKSPIRDASRPAAKRREQFLRREEFDGLRATVKDVAFGDVLEFCWETGCRVQEVRVVEAAHCQMDRGRVTLPAELAKGKKRERVILLTRRAEEIVRRLAARHSQGPIFRNAKGKPWTAQTFNCRFCRIKKKLGVKYTLTSFRHSFATRMVEAGKDLITVSKWLGHCDATMLTKVYQHVGEKSDFLRDQLLKVSDGETSA